MAIRSNLLSNACYRKLLFPGSIFCTIPVATSISCGYKNFPVASNSGCYSIL